MSFPMFGPWGRWYPWYAPGFGWHAFGYDPWSYGATYWGWGRYGLWYDPYSYYWDPFWNSVTYGVGGGAAPKARETMGSVRIKANPESAKVYIDGALVGTVDEFDGLTDHLELQGGRHVLELRAEGFQAATKEIVVAVGRTQTVRISMKKVK